MRYFTRYAGIAQCSDISTFGKVRMTSVTRNISDQRKLKAHFILFHFSSKEVWNSVRLIRFHYLAVKLILVNLSNKIKPNHSLVTHLVINDEQRFPFLFRYPKLKVATIVAKKISQCSKGSSLPSRCCYVCCMCVWNWKTRQYERSCFNRILGYSMMEFLKYRSIDLIFKPLVEKMQGYWFDKFQLSNRFNLLIILQAYFESI